MNQKIISLLILILLISAGSGRVSAQVQDAGLWLAAEGSVKLRQRSFLVFNGELRMHENMMEAGTMLAETGFGYDFSRSWRLAAYYRFIARQQTDRSYQYRHRYYADLRYRHRAGKTDWTGRVRVQQQFRHEELFSSANADERTYMRPKASFRYRVSRTWRPYVSAEFYLPLSLSGIHPVDKMRFAAGTLYRINRVHSLNIYYMIQHQVNVKNPRTDFILGIGYEFTPGWEF